MQQYLLLVFLSCIFYSCHALIQFNQVPLSKVVVSGKPFWWSCTARLVGSPNTPLTYTWVINNQLLIANSNVELFQNGTLHIRSIGARNVGSYRCRAQGGGEIAFTDAATLSLAALASSFSSDPSSQSIFVGNPLILECSIQSNPPAIISWQRNGLALDQGVVVLTRVENLLTVGTLQISAVDYTHGGQYRCMAGNALLVEQATFSAYADITLQGRPGFATSPSPQTSFAGDSVSFHCATTGSPSATIQWLNDNDAVIQNAGRFIISGDMLRISVVQLSDRGYYTCKAANKWGENTASALLTVLSDPSQQVVFTDTPSDVSIRIGGRVTFSCAGTGNPEPSITWTKQGGVLPSDRIDWPAAGWLRISNIETDDMGIYTCTLSNEITMVTARAQLIVLEPPSFLIRPSDVTVSENGLVKLDCVADGSPFPAISWTTPVPGLGTLSSPSAPTSSITVLSNGTLIIQSVDRQHAGDYACMATNVLGSISTSLKISILSPPEITLFPSDQTKIEGSQTQLSCRGGSSFLLVSISWHFQNEYLQTGSHYEVFGNGDLRISNIRKEHEGVYTCKVENDVGFQEASASLRVLVPPTFTVEPEDVTVDIGSNVALNCKAVGDPNPDLEWQKDGAALVLEDNLSFLGNYSLLISGMREKNIGTYTCIASSEAGVRDTTAEVTTPDYPEFTVQPSNVTANHSQPFTLRCRATAREAPTISWYISDASGGQGSGISSGQDAYVSTEGDLEFLVVSQDDEGWYLCEAANNVGSVKRWIYLSINSAPVILSTNSPVSVMKSDITAILRCDIDGEPSPEVMWYLPSGSIVPDESAIYDQRTVGQIQYLVVHSPSVEIHDGDFFCEASNMLGKVRESVTVSIQGMPIIVSVTATASSSSVTLMCQSKGAPKPVVTWFRNGLPLTLFFREAHTVLTDGRLLIADLISAETGEYDCRLVNIHGTATASLSVPNQPAPPIINSVTPSSITLMWTPPEAASNVTTDMYVLGYYDVSNETDLAVVHLMDTTYTFDDLRTYTGYRFRVQARNGLGGGSFSLWTSMVFTSETVPSIPQGLDAEVLGNSIKVVWRAPELLNGPTGHIIYEISYGLVSAAQSTYRTQVVPYSGQTQQLTLSDLRDATEYQIRIRAKNTKLGLWSEGALLVKQTSVNAPSSSIQNFMVLANGSEALLASWQAVNDSSFLSYLLAYRHLASGISYPPFVIEDSSTTEFVIKNLREGAEYAVKISYTNAGGQGPYTPEKVAVTDEAPSSTPLSLPQAGGINSGLLAGVLCGTILLLVIILLVVLIYRWKQNKREFSGAGRTSPDSLWINRRGSEKKATYEVAIFNENFQPDDTVMSTDSAYDLGGNDYVEMGGGSKEKDAKEDKKSKKKKKWRSISDVIYRNPENPGVVLVKKAVIADSSPPPVELKSEDVLNQEDTSPKLLDATLDVRTPELAKKEMSPTPSPEFPVFPNADDSIHLAGDTSDVINKSLFSLDRKQEKALKKKEKKERKERDKDFDIGYKKRKTLSDLIRKKMFAKRRYSLDDIPHLEPHSSSLDRQKEIAALY